MKTETHCKMIGGHIYFGKISSSFGVEIVFAFQDYLLVFGDVRLRIGVSDSFFADCKQVPGVLIAPFSY